MELTVADVCFWLKLESLTNTSVPAHIKNAFHICGFSNKYAFRRVSRDDILYVEQFIRSELLQRLSAKCTRLNITLDELGRSRFFGTFSADVKNFEFTENDRETICSMALNLKENLTKFDCIQNETITSESDQVHLWFDDKIHKNERIPPVNESSVAFPANNLISKIQQTAAKNASRPKQGYRYGNDIKKFAVYNRMLSGSLGFRSIQGNLKGALPSISTTNKFIHRSDHAIVEGELRCDELLVYLKEKSLPMLVSLSEDATRVENRLQYDSRTNQIMGFVLPTNNINGMPIPFVFKAGSVHEMVRHFSDNFITASYMNTIMAQPLGDAQPFCLLIFGSDNRYTSNDVAKRWNYITEELRKLGIVVLCFSSDSDPRYNSAMRNISGLGSSSIEFPGQELFKTNTGLKLPFCIQDYPHIGTKLRNLFLKTIDNPDKLPFGKFFIRVKHVREVMEKFDKDKHLLTNTVLDPADKQNFNSVLRICDYRVIKYLRDSVEGSDATILFLQILSDFISAFMDRNLSPIQRLEKMWYGAFIVRIWRHYVSKQPGLTLKENFMSSLCYYCIELNAHSLVSIILYLKDKNLTHLFIPYLFCSQPCEAFYRQIRSFTSTYSTVVNCSTKEFTDRVSRIQLQNEISNDTNLGFYFPESLKSCKITPSNDKECNFPSKSDIIKIISECKTKAFKDLEKFQLFGRNKAAKNSSCICKVPPYVSTKKVEEKMKIDINVNLELYDKLAHACLKNYSFKFKAGPISETSSYVEVFGGDSRTIFKKTSVVWFLRKENYKCSSDRIYRVMGPKKQRKKKPRVINKPNVCVFGKRLIKK